MASRIRISNEVEYIGSSGIVQRGTVLDINEDRSLIVARSFDQAPLRISSAKWKT